VGETPNLASRLQSLAEPNTVLIDENTRRLIGGLFEYHDLGAVEARGFTGMVSAWQVLRPSAVESRFEALRASSPTPLVGRGEELEFLLWRWERAKKGEGQAVLLSGEPGIGKSRITTAVAERLYKQPHHHLRYFCAPHHQDTALHPVIAHLERGRSMTKRSGSSISSGSRLPEMYHIATLSPLQIRFPLSSASHSAVRRMCTTGDW